MQKRSTFFSFKHYFCQEQKKKGIQYANNEELEKAAYPVWLDTAPKKRITIKELSAGIITKVELREQGIAKSAERSSIKHFVRSKIPDNAILDEPMYLIDVNCYCVTSAGRHLIGECCVVRFSLREGILGHYHNHVNPGKIPIGYQRDVKQNSKELGLKTLNEDADRNDWSLLSDIKTFVQFTRSCMLFTEPDKVPAVVDFIREITNNVGEDPAQFLVYKVDYLFYVLYNALNSGGAEFTREHAKQELERERFTSYPGLRCEHHYDMDKLGCTITRAKSWAYTILEKCCQAAGIDTQYGKHKPVDYCQHHQEPSSSSNSAFEACNNASATDDVDKSSTITEKLERTNLKTN